MFEKFMIEVGELEVCLGHNLVRFRGSPLNTMETEWKVLRYLALRATVPISCEDLVEHLRGTIRSKNHLAVLVNKTRRRLGREGRDYLPYAKHVLCDPIPQEIRHAA